MLRLSDFSVRALELLASRIAGTAVELLLSPQARHPLTVTLGTTSLLLHPHQAGLYDLLLGACLLRFRDEAKELQPRCPFAPQVVRSWVDRARQELAHRFPGAVRKCQGVFHPQSPSSRQLPYCSWQQAPWKKLKETLGEPGKLPGAALPLSQPAALLGGSLDLGTSPEETYDQVVQAIRDGLLPRMDCPELRRVPVYTLWGQVAPSQKVPEGNWFRFEMMLRRKAIAEFQRCFVRTATNQQQVAPFWLRHTQGAYLDGARLAEAALSLVTGTPGRVFRRKQHWQTEPVFRPEEHFVLRISSEAFRNTQGVTYSPIERIIAKIFRQLGVRYGLIVLADQVLQLPDGERAYLHLPVLVKHPLAPFDDHFWRRLVAIENTHPVLPHAHLACVPTVAVRTAAAMLEILDPHYDCNRHCPMFSLSSPLPREEPWGFFHAPWFLSGVAEKLNQLLEELAHKYQQRRHTLQRACQVNLSYLFLWSKLQKYGKPGTYVSRAVGE